MSSQAQSYQQLKDIWQKLAHRQDERVKSKSRHGHTLHTNSSPCQAHRKKHPSLQALYSPHLIRNQRHPSPYFFLKTLIALRYFQLLANWFAETCYSLKHTYFQNRPRVLDSSALWRWGSRSASRFRAACAQTIKAFCNETKRPFSKTFVPSLRHVPIKCVSAVE